MDHMVVQEMVDLVDNHHPQVGCEVMVSLVTGGGGGGGAGALNTPWNFLWWKWWFWYRSHRISYLTKYLKSR